MSETSAQRELPQTINADAIYDIAQVAAAFHVCVRSVRRWIDAKDFPAPFRQGRKWYWRGATLIAHFERSQAA